MAKRPSTSVAPTAAQQMQRDNAAANGSNETRERILEAAHTLLRVRGYEGTTMSQLAKDAGVTTPALYWHFASKAELCGEVLKRDYRTFLAELTERMVGDTAEERLRAYMSAFVELQLQEAELERRFGYRQLQEFVDPDASVEIHQLELKFRELLKQILSDGIETGEFAIGDLSATAMGLSTMCEYVFVWFRPEGRLTARDVGAVYADVAVRMVRAEPQT
jgi:AcrR family transcriptional regulator